MSYLFLPLRKMLPSGILERRRVADEQEPALMPSFYVLLPIEETPLLPFGCVELCEGLLSETVESPSCTDRVWLKFLLRLWSVQSTVSVLKW